MFLTLFGLLQTKKIIINKLVNSFVYFYGLNVPFQNSYTEVPALNMMVFRGGQNGAMNNCMYIYFCIVESVS